MANFIVGKPDNVLSCRASLINPDYGDYLIQTLINSWNATRILKGNEFHFGTTNIA